MEFLLTKNERILSPILKRWFIFWGLVTVLAIVLVLRNYGVDRITLGLILGLPILGLLIFNFDAFLGFFVFSIFINESALLFKVAVLLTLPFLVSFLITTTEIKFEEIKNPLSFPFFIYLISIVPSFFNSLQPVLSIYLTYNLFAMVIVYHIIQAKLNKYKEVEKFILLFLAFCVLNGAAVYIEAIMTGSRSFGPSGIVFVDYSVMAIFIGILFLIFKKGVSRYFYLFITMFLLGAQILTETRNTLLSLVLTFMFLGFYLIKKSTLLKIKKYKLIIIYSSIVIIFLVITAVIIINNPQILNRYSTLGGNEKAFIVEQNKVGANSSIITRILIWMTAWNAFINHPIIGIGAFAFPFSSQLYNQLPPVLYKLFVEKLGTHITFLSTLTETGIIGTLGFIFFVFASLRVGFKSVNLSKDRNEILISLIIITLQVYIFFSMFMTDSWLRGQCGMLWGFILGLSLANYKILSRKNAAVDV